MGILNHEDDFRTENNLKMEDVALLYNNFLSLCNYIETTGESCSVCPINQTICFHKEKGEQFWNAMKRIDNEVNKHNI